MKEEMKWITIWILTNTVMATLSLIYLYLNHELPKYGVWTISLCFFSIILPYLIWKYNQIKVDAIRPTFICMLSEEVK